MPNSKLRFSSAHLTHVMRRATRDALLRHAKLGEMVVVCDPDDPRKPLEVPASSLDLSDEAWGLTPEDATSPKAR